MINSLKLKDEVQYKIRGLPLHMEEENEVKVTEEDLGLIKFVIEESIQNMESYEIITESFLKCNWINS